MTFIEQNAASGKTQELAATAKVKPLEWRQGYRDAGCNIVQASTIPFYQIRQLDGVIWLDIDNHQTIYPSVDAAKAAAQADYEQRIRSALVDVPAVEPAAWRPIETAPKDGTPILAFNPVIGVYNTAYQAHEEDERDRFPCGFSGFLGAWFVWPTHWMPAPPRPDAASKLAGSSPVTYCWGEMSEWFTASLVPLCAKQGIDALDVLRRLYPIVEDMDDEGPWGERWQSDEFKRALADAKALLEADEAVS